MIDSDRRASWIRYSRLSGSGTDHRSHPFLEDRMFVAPGEFAQRISHEAAQRVASNWWRLLLNGVLLIVAGVLIFSIDWSIRSLATFLGALFILEGLTTALTAGIDERVRRANVILGLLSVAVGVAIIVWPAPG